MIFKNEVSSTLEREPYVSFLRKYEKLSSVTNEEITLQINSTRGRKGWGYRDGFCLDYIYSKHFDLKFRYFQIIEDERRQTSKFCIVHSICFAFDDVNHQDMMMETIEDINAREGYYYLSSEVEECKVDCSLNSKNIVSITFTVICEKRAAKEVSLQLISQDIAMFTRSF